MDKKDIRWVQRFANYRKALLRLSVAVKLLSERMAGNEELDDLLKEGLIQRFEYTHELAWKVMKDYAEYQGYSDIRGPRDAIRKALEINLISDRRWMESIEERNLTFHDYDEETANNICKNIITIYYPLFADFEKVILSLLE